MLPDAQLTPEQIARIYELECDHDTPDHTSQMLGVTLCAVCIASLVGVMWLVWHWVKS